MISASAAYWTPVVVDNISKPPGRYEGYIETKHKDVDKLFSNALDNFMDIYGTVVDAHYVVEDVSENDSGSYNFTVITVVTGLVDSELDFEDNIYDHWPTDITEQLHVTLDELELDGIVGYDLSPTNAEPLWSKFNQ